MVGNLPLLLKKINFPMYLQELVRPIIQKESTNWSNMLSFFCLAVSLVRSSNQRKIGTFSYFQLYLLAFNLFICYTIFKKI